MLKSFALNQFCPPDPAGSGGDKVINSLATLNPFVHRMFSWAREDIWGHQHCSVADQKNNETYSWYMCCPSLATLSASCQGLCLWRHLYRLSFYWREELGNQDSWPDLAAQELQQDVTLTFWTWLKWMAFYNPFWKGGGGNSGPMEVAGGINWVCGWVRSLGLWKYSGNAIATVMTHWPGHMNQVREGNRP